MRPELERLQTLLESFVGERGTLRVLEAGCGSYPMVVDLGPAKHIVGIDISQRQLERNDVVDEKILGDIQTFPLRPQDFDLVFCFNVLEHLDRPDRALANFRRALRPGGLIVIKVPNVLSLKGLMTKFSPHRVHVWVYRYILGHPDAGQDDKAPFPTFLRLSMSPPALDRFARRNGLQVAYSCLFEAHNWLHLRQRLRLDGRLWHALRFAVERVTRNTITLEGTEFLIVMQSAGAPGRAHSGSPVS
jgi:SAM-dependent methyltransferase